MELFFIKVTSVFGLTNQKRGVIFKIIEIANFFGFTITKKIGEFLCDMLLSAFVTVFFLNSISIGFNQVQVTEIEEVAKVISVQEMEVLLQTTTDSVKKTADSIATNSMLVDSVITNTKEWPALSIMQETAIMQDIQSNIEHMQSVFDNIKFSNEDIKLKYDLMKSISASIEEIFMQYPNSFFILKEE